MNVDLLLIQYINMLGQPILEFGYSEINDFGLVKEKYFTILPILLPQLIIFHWYPSNDKIICSVYWSGWL